ncbi:MAG TPA: cytochrome c peroxidase [Myxococcaceae bacterium]|nr:cytochrome c peroxidase [Myxococcaceae bacterium]
MSRVGALLLLGCGAGCGDAPVAPDEVGLDALERLGKRLFEDPSLSEPAGLSCAGCHDSKTAFTGNNGSSVPAVARGSRDGQLGTRNTPTLGYVGFIPSFHFEEETGDDGSKSFIPVGGQFWDGRAANLVAQVQSPLTNPREMNNASVSDVVRKVSTAPYASLMRAVFGPDVLEDDDRAIQKIGEAIAAFERSKRFQPFSSKFDDFLRGKAELTQQEALGFQLFKDPRKANCLACHVGDESSRSPEDWLFTDFTYDNLGLPRNGAIPDNADPSHFDRGLCNRTDLQDLLPPGTDTSSLCGAFKVPTLRNAAITAPYGHNGSLTTLRDVVVFYVTRGPDPGRWYRGSSWPDDLVLSDVANMNSSEVPYDRRPGEAPRLDDAEIDAVVAFLRTLTDRQE